MAGLAPKPRFVAFAIVSFLALVLRIAPARAQVCYSCPDTDSEGFPLGVSDLTTDPIFCSYPSFQGEDPNDFFCTYSKTTGLLVTDHDADLCHSNAPQIECPTTPTPGITDPAPVASDQGLVFLAGVLLLGGAWSVQRLGRG